MMKYHEFETTFEELFQTPKDSYPHAVEYHQASFQHSIQHLLFSILNQAETLTFLA